MDRLDAMHLFVRVAETGSFSGVAQQLGVARSVVTRQIAALEAHLGVKLMARSTRRLALTASGTTYLEKCRVILNLVEVAEADVAEERATPHGRIRVSVPLSFGLKRVAPLLLDFLRRYPEVGLDMDYSDRRVNLIEEGIDLSIRIARRLAAQGLKDLHPPETGPASVSQTTGHRKKFASVKHAFWRRGGAEGRSPSRGPQGARRRSAATGPRSPHGDRR